MPWLPRLAWARLPWSWRASRVMMLITPRKALAPKVLELVPRTTSMRSISSTVRGSAGQSTPPKEPAAYTERPSMRTCISVGKSPLSPW